MGLERCQHPSPPVLAQALLLPFQPGCVLWRASLTAASFSATWKKSMRKVPRALKWELNRSAIHGAPSLTLWMRSKAPQLATVFSHSQPAERALPRVTP